MTFLLAVLGIAALAGVGVLLRVALIHDVETDRSSCPHLFDPEACTCTAPDDISLRAKARSITRGGHL